MKYEISFNGRNYEVEVEIAEPMTLSQFQTYAPAAPVAAAAAAPVAAEVPAASSVTGPGEVIDSPMPGTILRVNVQNGQAVKEGDVLCILEAMKMENEIMAPRAGTVTQVLVTKGSSVDTGAPLVVLA